MSIAYATIVPVHILIAPVASLRCLRDDHEPHEGLLVITHTLMGDLSLALPGLRESHSLQRAVLVGHLFQSYDSEKSGARLCNPDVAPSLARLILFTNIEVRKRKQVFGVSENLGLDFLRAS